MSDKPVLAVYDVRGIQEFIFRTHSLKEIDGASQIVACLFDKAMEQAVKKSGFASHPVRLDWQGYDDFKFLDEPAIPMERVYTGAGNTYIAFREEGQCKAFNRYVSRYIFQESYSLNLAIAYVFLNPQKTYSELYQELQDRLRLVKEKMPLTRLAGAFPITRQDTATGFPFSHWDTASQNPISRESLLKLKAYEEVPERQKLMDHFITEKGRDSQIAIVHIDGNNMGKKFGLQMKGEKDIRAAVAKLRSISRQIDSEFKGALHAAESALDKFIHSEQNLLKEDCAYFRPVICSGDDITFICNAGIAISLCEVFLNHLVSYKACAGIAICNSHFPFYAAYNLAEACCASAKERAKERIPGEPGNYIDFQICRHIAAADNLERYRKKHYRQNEVNLLSRPYCVDMDIPTNDSQHISFFKEAVKAFSKPEFARNSAKDLRNAYSISKEAAEAVYRKLQSRGKELPGAADSLYRSSGSATEAVFFDALEMQELYIDLCAGDSEKKNCQAEEAQV